MNETRNMEGRNFRRRKGTKSDRFAFNRSSRKRKRRNDGFLFFFYSIFEKNNIVMNVLERERIFCSSLSLSFFSKHQSKASPLPSTSSSDWSSGIFPPSPSPLHLAAERHRSQLCSLLLRGADDEKKDNVDNDSSPLAILLSNLLDCEGNSPLHCVVKHPAARNQQDVERAIKTIQILKGAGAERRMRNRKGESPASLAESRGWPLEVVNLLKQDNVAE